MTRTEAPTQGDRDDERDAGCVASATGAPVAVSKKKREFIPVGIITSVAKDAGAEKPAQATSKAELIGTVQVSPNPDGADVCADGAFVKCPTALQLVPPPQEK